MLAALATLFVATSTPTVELLTFGRGEDPFSHFGHAAVCITDAQAPGGRCLNFGTADFTTPVPLTLSFLRGEAMFWVSVVDRDATTAWYREQDRSIERQRLRLAPDELTRLIALLDASSVPEVRYYRYHHFDDNCTTRIRDLIDRAIDGKLRAETAQVPSGRTLRDLVEEGFGDQLLLLTLSHLLIGRAVDRPISEWEAMFLPRAFKESVAARLGADVELEYASGRPERAPLLWAGHAVILALGLIGAVIMRASAKVGAIVLAVPAALAVLVVALAIGSVQPELAVNEAILVLCPLDPLAAARSKIARNYRRFRLGILAALGLLAIAGVLVQPIGSTVVALAAILLVAERR